MKKIILNIPHSSTFIPYKDGFIISNKEISDEQLLLTDWYTDELFYCDMCIIIKAEFSRIFCDIERFEDDLKENMAQCGMGSLYTKRDNGSEMRKVDQRLRNKIINEFYKPYHNKLNSAVNEQLQVSGSALIIDCHSFSDIPFNRDENKDENRPDINIGIDKFHTDNKLRKISEKFFKDKGFSVLIDRPYSGTIVTMEHYNKNKNVRSLMIEINRKLYLKENTNIKNEKFETVKKTINEFLNKIGEDLF